MATVTVRGIRAEIRAARLRSRPVQARRERNDTIYLVILGIVVYGGILVQAVRRMIEAPPVGPAPPNLPVAQWLFVGCAVLGLGLLVRALLVFGPVVASGPFQFWLLSTPLNRRSLLGRRFWWLAVIGAVAGGVAGLAVSALLKADLVGKLLSTSICAGMAAGAVAVCALLQQKAHNGNRLSTVLVVTGASVAGVAVFAPPPVLDLPVVAAVVLVAPIVVLVLAYRALGTLDRAALAGGAELLAASRVAVNWMDISLFTGIASARKWRAVGKVRSRGLRGARYQAMVFADVRRLSRNRAAFYVWAGLLLAPYAAQRLLPETFVPTVQLVACAVAVNPFAAGLRHICRSAAMRRSLGGSDAGLRLAHLVVPTVMALLWTVGTSPASGFALASALVPVGAVAFVYRRASQPSFDYSGGAVDTPFGLFQPNMVRQLLRGPLLLLFVAAVQLYL
ncbi:hypothetical protein ALI144C_15330 [Actinosynnema sp. ALI-1.44]|uniref:DUF6297 family protein n=1 Tax=Actinosynnema sp. ALI-1.44 TaxID=1933779 RepID=UPI00097BE197|nr:DUF6297 family protein [Actinosynnema sp. ALI-1.44]ONI84077.1 hypothetical protein ALI144C_15330 [Actinosynnema sp. ALI-1.44]